MVEILIVGLHLEKVFKILHARPLHLLACNLPSKAVNAIFLLTT
jgi:hypothetical protein